MHFESEYIKDVLSSVSLSDVMRQHGVSVRKGAGKNDSFVASWCCGKSDFDNGRISTDRTREVYDLYECKACRQGGNAINFLRNKEGMSFFDAVVWLAKYANIPLPEEQFDPERKQFEQRKQKALQEAVRFYKMQKHDYMIRRGCTVEVLDDLNAGYAPGGRALRNHLQQRGYSKEELHQFGLVNDHGMDSFFYRSVFPIYMNQRIVDLYGRAVDDKKTQVKHFYLYGTTTLDGLDRIDPNKKVLLLEGHTDKAVAESFGIKNAVTPGGAHKFNVAHARLLKKKGVKSVVIMFDGDDAGKEGTLAAGQLLTDLGLRVEVVEFSDKDDVAKLLLEGGIDSLLPYTRNIKPFQVFKYYSILEGIPLDIIETYLNEAKGAVGDGCNVRPNDKGRPSKTMP